MRWILAWFLYLPLMGVDCDRSPVLVSNVGVWNGYTVEPGRDVLFRNGRVASIRTTGATASKLAGTRVIDGTGHTLLPGLLDLHLHFVIPGLPKSLDAAAISGRQLLRSGVTAGRLHLASLSDAASFTKRGADDCAAFPRIQAGGPGLSGGTPNLESPAFSGVRDASDAAAKVDRVAAAGLDWLAVHNVDRFSPQEIAAIMTAARKRKIRVFASATTASELRSALAISADTLDYIDRSAEPGYSPELLKRLRDAKKTALAPTLGIFERYAAMHSSPALADDSGLYEFVPAEAVGSVRDQVRADLAKNSYVLEAEKFRPTLRAKLLQLIATGLPIAIATDVGSPAYLHPGAIWWEMETWRLYGVPVQQVLRAATSVPAEILGWRDAGQLRKGARADFVLYRGDVLDGPLDYRRIMTVGKGGVLFVPPRN